ncbi:MAG: hypothetical protein IT436_14455 [Phycisphaerales bacterium]|nr:hypothetical protein [Phycisphaerales bacterium]
MREGALSPWDRLREERSRASLRLLFGEPRWVTRAREARRIDAFERGHLEVAAIGRLSEPARLSRDLRDRTDYWSAGQPARAEPSQFAAELSRIIVAYALVILGGFTLIFLLLTGVVWLTLPVVAVMWVARQFITQRGLLARLNLAAGGRRCPGCRYDLADSPPGLPPEALDGQWPGPRRCTECGAAWPLIPPPVPASA